MVVNGQFATDIKLHWEMIHDDRNPASRPWRWNMTNEERGQWIRSTPVQPDYSMPRARSKRIMEGHVMPEVPSYNTAKWKESLNQPGYESFYPLAKNTIHDNQLPGRYNEKVPRKIPGEFARDKAGECRSSQEEHDVHYDRLYGKLGKTRPLPALRRGLHSFAVSHSRADIYHVQGDLWSRRISCECNEEDVDAETSGHL